MLKNTQETAAGGKAVGVYLKKNTIVNTLIPIAGFPGILDGIFKTSLDLWLVCCLLRHRPSC